MSLGGFALAIGVLVDASIVMVENGHRHLAAAAAAGALTEPERRRTLLDAARQVGRPIFYSLLIIVVSFLPVFLLEAQEGRLFRPLAWTKTLAIAVLLDARDHGGAAPDAVADSRPALARARPKIRWRVSSPRSTCRSSDGACAIA